MSDSITFKAYIPNLQSAIQVAGDGGWRVKLDIPASEEGKALELLTMRGVVLEVTVRPAPDEPPRRDW
jgi:hypothetical protein